MPTPKIDHSQLNDPRALAQFQQTRQAEADGARAAQAEAGAETQASVRPEGERLEISSSARKLEQMRDLLEAGQAKLDEADPVRREKMETVQRRLQSGVYGSNEIRQQVAGRLTELMRGLDTLLE